MIMKSLQKMITREENTTLIKAHIPCQYCGSSDAGALYSDGFYCFSCNTYVPAKGGEQSVEADEVVKDIISYGYAEIPERGLSEEVCRFYDYGIGRYNGQIVHVANYRYGSKRKQHIRTPDKQFFWLGGGTAHVELFGQHLYQKQPYLIITEGEIDCLTVAQLKLKQFLVVSVPNGAANATKAVLDNYDFIRQFELIYLWFDTDKAGQQAVEKLVIQLPPGKVYIIDSAPYKDANEVFLAWGANAVLNRIKQARLYRPDHLISVEEMDLEKVMKTPENENFKVGFNHFNNFYMGLRKHELTMIGAGTGVGKSTYMRQLAYDLLMLNPSVKIAYIALEETIIKTLLGFVAMDNNVALGDLYLNRELIPPESMKDSIGKFKERLLFYDHFGSIDPLNMLQKIEYLAKAEGIDFLFLDHLTILISGLEIQDERKAIDVFLTRLRSLIENTNIGVIMISHVSNNSAYRGKAPEEGGKISIKDFRGSGSIGQLSDNVISLQRNIVAKQPEDRRRTEVYALKNRLFGENTGLMGTLEYISGKLYETEVYHA